MVVHSPGVRSRRPNLSPEHNRHTTAGSHVVARAPPSDAEGTRWRPIAGEHGGGYAPTPTRGNHGIRAPSGERGHPGGQRGHAPHPALRRPGGFDDAQRGLVATLDEPVIRTTSGRVVWDLTPYAYQSIDASCPATVNPSLWRQAQLNSIHGLFEVAPGIYQVRGYDLSNMTIIEGDTGIIVIDPLISSETAAAALALYAGPPGRAAGRRRASTPTATSTTSAGCGHRGQGRRQVAGASPVIAPEGFLEHTVAENVYAGTAMQPARPVHVRRPARQGRPGPGRRRSGQDQLARPGVADRPDAVDHPDRRGARE